MNTVFYNSEKGRAFATTSTPGMKPNYSSPKGMENLKLEGPEKVLRVLKKISASRRIFQTEINLCDENKILQINSEISYNS